MNMYIIYTLYLDITGGTYKFVLFLRLLLYDNFHLTSHQYLTILIDTNKQLILNARPN